MFRPGRLRKRACGLLVLGSFGWLPREDRVAEASERLVLRRNPSWTAANSSGSAGSLPKWAEGDYDVRAFFDRE